jgi:hypothetical protein
VGGAHSMYRERVLVGKAEGMRPLARPRQR